MAGVPSELWIRTLTSVTIVSLISLVGVLALSLGRRSIGRISPLLVALAAGSLLGGALFHILPRAIEILGPGLDFSIPFVIAFLAFFVLERFLWTHHHGEEEAHAHGSAKPGKVRPVVAINLLGDSLNNFIDGVVIAAGYQIDPALGLAATIAVALHEIPQELGDFGVLVSGGLTPARAILFNFLCATTAILGAVFGLAAGARSDSFVALLLPVAAANFLYIAAADLIPELHRGRRPGEAFRQVLLVAAGAAIMALVKIYADPD